MARIRFFGDACQEAPGEGTYPAIMDKTTTWLITGVGSGFGEAIAAAALARGEKVCGTVRSDEARDRFEAVAPGRAIGLLLDVTDAAAIPPVVAEAERALGRIDRLVNNAGHGLTGAIEETSLTQAKALFDVNLFGAIAMIQAVLPGMRGRGAGHIVNITSVSGLAPWAGTGLYGATKYALECIGQTLAQEIAPFGIRVTNVAPGGFRTAFASPSLVAADTPIAGYDGTPAHDAHRILSADSGRQKGDPARAAAAILAALDSEDPPLHLLLGEDALHYAEGAVEALAGDIDRWRALSLSTAFVEP